MKLDIYGVIVAKPGAKESAKNCDRTRLSPHISIGAEALRRYYGGESARVMIEAAVMRDVKTLSENSPEFREILAQVKASLAG